MLHDATSLFDSTLRQSVTGREWLVYTWHPWVIRVSAPIVAASGSFGSTVHSRLTKCLESSFATAADVCLFWLAVQASFEELFKNSKNVIKLPVRVLEKIRQLSNYHFNQTINSTPSDTEIRGQDGTLALAKLNEQILAYSWITTTLISLQYVNVWLWRLTSVITHFIQFFAVKIFSITVNSIADERTASTITWLNSALRQWYLMSPENVRRRFLLYSVYSYC